MKYSLVYIFILLICVNCRSSSVQYIKYDCQLFKSDFNEWEYLKGSTFESTFIKFKNEVINGAYFINNIKGQDNKIIILEKINNKSLITNSLKNGESVILPFELQKNIDRILLESEKGSFRQFCFEGPSEGSFSLLIVKVNGNTVLKYEAKHHDYSHLNNNEKWKIKNALELINILVKYGFE